MNGEAPVGWLVGLIIVLIALSAFFSGTETALDEPEPLPAAPSVARRPPRRATCRVAAAAAGPADRPDPARQHGRECRRPRHWSTIVALRVGGERAILAGTFILTVVMLIFGEVAPKTIAALNPARVALPAALIYYPLLKDRVSRRLGSESARERFAATARRARGSDRVAFIERRRAAHRRRRGRRDGAASPPEMLLSILDLDAVTVDDMMVPRQEIVGLDLDRTWNENLRDDPRRAATIGCPSIAETSTTSSVSRAFAICCPSSCVASSPRRCCSSEFASRTSCRRARR